MATWTAASGGGNWNATTTWEEGGGYPVAGDTAVLDSGSGNVTVNVTSACDNLTCTGYTGTFTLNAQLTLYGNLLLVSGMTYVAGPNGLWAVFGITFAATTTGKTINTGGKDIGELIFNGSGGEWTLQADCNSGAYPGRTTFTAGDIIFNGYTITGSQTSVVSDGCTLTIGTGAFNNGYNSLTVEDGATITMSSGSMGALGSLTIDSGGAVTCTGAASITTNGAITLGSGFTCGTSTIIQWIGNLSSSSNLYNYIHGVSWYWADSTTVFLTDIVILNDFTIAAIDSYISVVDCDTYDLTVGGDFTNNETFDAGSGTTIINDSAQSTTIGGSQNTTFNILQCLTAGKAVKFKQDSVTTVASFDFTGTSGAGLININTDTGSGHFHISDSTGTNTVEYCDIHNSTAEGGATWNAFTSDGNVDGGGNTGWNFSSVSATVFQINIGDVWKNISGASTIQINIGDVWKDVSGASINIGDAWKTIF